MQDLAAHIATPRNTSRLTEEKEVRTSWNSPHAAMLDKWEKELDTPQSGSVNSRAEAFMRVAAAVCERLLFSIEVVNTTTPGSVDTVAIDYARKLHGYLEKAATTLASKQ